MSRIGVEGVLQRVSFGVFGVLGLVFIVGSIGVIAADPSTRAPAVLAGLLCVMALEIAWIRVGSVAHRSPAMSLPVLVVPALTPVLPDQAIIGVIMLGVFMALLAESRRLDVSVYSAGLAGTASLFYILIEWLLTLVAVGPVPAAGVASAGYVMFVLAVEVLRMRLIDAPSDRGGRPLISPLRLSLLIFVLATLAMASVYWADAGLPTPGIGRTALQTAGGTLLGSLVVALVAIVARTVLHMRRRLSGLVLGSSILSATRSGDSTADVAESLCEAVSVAVGVQSVALQAEPAATGQIGTRISFTDDDARFVVARRDLMDGAFTRVDRRAFEALAATAELVMQARRNLDGITARANTDALTGLPNYGAFQEALDTINSKRGEAEAIAVLFIDLDAFKHINDTHGHQAGDSVLQVVGQRMRQAVRPHDVVARVGGDEFVIILTRLSAVSEAVGLAETILAAATLPISLGEITLSPRLSIGLAFSALAETDVAELVLDADESMLVVKKARRRGTAAAASSIHISAHRSSQYKADVARAIDHDELDVAYQPIVSLVTGKIWAFEALLRYVDPEFGAISPPALVEQAKNLGRFDLLTRQIAVRAMAAAAEFRLAEPAIVCMAINVDADQIAQDRLGAFFEDLFLQHPGISLCLEFNERSAVRVSPSIRQQADRLRDLGILIALDDYGSDDSSVDSLVRVPMDILKIDRSLVDDLDDIRQREVLTALQGFGDNLEYSMIVEGVEDEAMADQLARLGIRSAQGFHFGVPQTFVETIARLDAFGAQAVRPARPDDPPRPTNTVRVDRRSAMTHHQ
ncbi:EAL domain-containing protein [Cryobacterium sp. PH29-G1]|uniref:putative bifunctional diguanylate cyclase/phosphodiesterase n=1 Tax=Cryobacterium sp. PH29-G1 TaxID=3046211 RepID=UPI0024B8F38E|nr:EAL domain-containing protein [Cryobacterium sp. PH29-G1]MDJ0350028.1 EAL domain-containing protein [Cryobacterium sp. PH29-G1]